MTAAAGSAHPAVAMRVGAPAVLTSERACDVDVLIVGGGLQGMSSALHLARRGVRTLLLEADYCGRHASGVNAGGVRTLGRHLAEIPLALAARDEIWHHIQEYVEDRCGFVASGQLQVIESDADQAKAAERVQMLNAAGFWHERLIGREEVRELVPAISSHVQGGIWVERDGYALPFRTVTAFRLAAQRAGADIREGMPVQRVYRRDGLWHAEVRGEVFRARTLVNTAGAWAGEIATQVGDPVPVQAGGLMLMVTRRVAPFVNPVLGAVGRPLSFKQFDNGTVVIGGGLRCTADPQARVADVDVSTMGASARTVTELFPHLADIAIARAWGGVEAFMPDLIPVIGFSRQGHDVVHAFGFSAHGFEMGPVVGRIVSELVCDGESRLPIAPFSVERFF